MYAMSVGCKGHCAFENISVTMFCLLCIPWDISLSLVQNVPTLCVLPVLGIFYKFCTDVQTCNHVGGGGGV